MTRQMRAVVIAAFVAIAAMLLYLVAVRDASTDSKPAGASSSSSASASSSATTTAANVASPSASAPVATATMPPMEPPAASGAPTTTLVLGGDWSADREAIEAALAKKDVSALPALEAVDLTKNGYVAAAAIDAVGKLAPLAADSERKQAVATLARWLAAESARKSPDARGNVSILVDAMGETKSKEAVAPLLASLEAGDQPLHLETRIVQVLATLGDKAAVPAVERWSDRVSKESPPDDYGRELVKEALAAGSATVATLQQLP